MTIKAVSAAAGLALLAAVASTAAHAASCPEEHVLTEPRELRRAPDIGVKRPILGTVDLKGWRGVGNIRLRLRKLTIAPGGVVPTHGHGDRPSIVHILEGEIVEHNAFCAVPIVHKAGDTAPESGPGHIHWWENTTDQPVIIFSTDVVPYRDAENSDM